MSVEVMDAAKKLADQEARLLREARELDLLLESTQTEVNRLKAREEQSRAKLEDIRRNPANYQREEIFAASDEVAQTLERRVAMDGQLATLRSKRRSLDSVRQAIADATAAAAGAPHVAVAPAAPVIDEGRMRRAIVDAQEEERQRIARAVHDGPAQALANVVLQAEISERLFERDPSRSRSELAALRELVNKTLQEVRSFIFELRPMILDDLGLVPTTRRYVQTLIDKQKVRIDFSSSGRDRRLPADDEIAIFRCLQDALIERVERGQAKTLQLVLLWEEQSLEALVQTDGKPAATSAFGPGQRRSERLELLRAEASQDVRPDGSVVVSMRIPLRPLATIS